MARAVALAAVVLAAACTVDAPVGRPLRRVLDVPPTRPEALDVLFVVDPSLYVVDPVTSTSRGQALMATAEAQLFARFDKLPDLHVGVISSEMQTGGLPAACDGAHNGVLRDGDGACVQHNARFIIDTPAGVAPPVTNYTGTLGDAITCLAALTPSPDCHVSQPLAAARAALQPGANLDFVRARAMLLVVFVTDRDDCSADVPSFYQDGEFGSLPIIDRCFAAAARCDEDATSAGVKHGCRARDDGGGGLSSIDAFVDELRALKDDPSMVMVAGIFAPPDAVVLAPRGDDLVPGSSCATGAAAPSFRLAWLAGQFPSRYAFASICGGAGGPGGEPMGRIGRTVAGVFDRSACVLGPLPANAPCHAYAERAGGRLTIPPCERPDPSAGGTCFYVAPDAERCADTESGLAAVAVSPPPDAHFVVECVAPDGL
jgi:hypothetical protein